MNNNLVIRESLGIALDAPSIAEKLRVPEDLLEEFIDIFDECAAVANPKFMYACHDVEHLGDITRVGISSFSSRIMQVNFENVNQAWPYISTCGRELYDLACSKDDPLERYWVDEISEQYLHHTTAMLMAEVKKASGLNNIYSMNPGSLADFPIDNQKPLFAIFGDVEKLIGVWLTDSFLMMPYKSVSGIYFESEQSYVNCALCPRKECPNRRAPYDEMQLNSRYNIKAPCADAK